MKYNNLQTLTKKPNFMNNLDYSRKNCHNLSHTFQCLTRIECPQCHLQ